MNVSSNISASEDFPFQVFIDQFSPERLSGEMELFVVLTAISFIPLFFIAATTFTRNIIVFSFLRSALGLQQSPPNIVLITIAIFLTIFVMTPVLEKAYDQGLSPYLKEEKALSIALQDGWQPFRNFMISQTHEKDIELIYKLGKANLPSVSSDVKNQYLIPAFLLSEIKIAFKIGFIIYLPFLLIDIVMAAILMSLGMIMVPPIVISLPMKIMLFVVVDGWSLVAETLVRSASG